MQCDIVAQMFSKPARGCHKWGDHWTMFSTIRFFRDDASKTVRLSSFLLACAKPNLESSGVSPKGIPFKLTPPGFHSRKMGRKMTRKVVLTWVCPPTEGDKKEKKTQSETGSENGLVPHRAGGGRDRNSICFGHCWPNQFDFAWRMEIPYHYQLPLDTRQETDCSTLFSSSSLAGAIRSFSRSVSLSCFYTCPDIKLPNRTTHTRGAFCPLNHEFILYTDFRSLKVILSPIVTVALSGKGLL